MNSIVSRPVRRDHVVDRAEEVPVDRNQAPEEAERRGREAGGPVAGAVRQQREHVGLVKEHVVVHQVAQLSVDQSAREETGP